jgi:hypothetical protein
MLVWVLARGVCELDEQQGWDVGSMQGSCADA